jgi:protein-disulfide isomerase
MRDKTETTISCMVAALIFCVFTLSFCQRDYCPCCPEKKQKELARSIIESFHVYDCCDRTIAECLKQKPVCGLAERLKIYVCRLVKKGKTEKYILDALSRRAQSMVALGRPAVIDTSDSPFIGDSSAKVVLTAYTCARCPFCRIIIPQLYDAITQGKLKNKVMFYIRIFPIRGHPGSVPGGLAFRAAGEMGKFWEYMLLAYEDFDNFSEPRLYEWAERLNMEAVQFRNICEKKETEQKLIESKKEGLANSVKATPTFFINGRKYIGDMDIETMIDVLEEELKRIKDKYHK